MPEIGRLIELEGDINPRLGQTERFEISRFLFDDALNLERRQARGDRRRFRFVGICRYRLDDLPGAVGLLERRGLT